MQFRARAIRWQKSRKALSRSPLPSRVSLRRCAFLPPVGVACAFDTLITSSLAIIGKDSLLLNMSQYALLSGGLTLRRNRLSIRLESRRREQSTGLAEPSTGSTLARLHRPPLARRIVVRQIVTGRLCRSSLSGADDHCPACCHARQRRAAFVRHDAGRGCLFASCRAFAVGGDWIDASWLALPTRAKVYAAINRLGVRRCLDPYDCRRGWRPVRFYRRSG